MALPARILPPRQRAPQGPPLPTPMLDDDGSQLQVRISELEPATNIVPTDLLEVSQGGKSRKMTVTQMKVAAAPDLSDYMTGIIAGDGLVVVGAAPVPTIKLGDLGAPGTFGDATTVPQISVDQFGRVSSVNLVQISIPDVSGFAPIDSPVFTGNPKAPTAPPGDNDTSLATTAFVQTTINARGFAPLNNPALTGTPSAPTPASGNNSTLLATTAFVEQRVSAIVPVDISHLAPIESPTFTGTPKAPTQPAIDATTNLATTAFVQAAIAARGATLYVDIAPPPSPPPNALWFNSELGNLFIFYNDGNTSQWIVTSPVTAAATVMSPGSVVDFAGDVVPDGWLPCQGQLASRALYPRLFAAIGEKYGMGDGSTTFVLPVFEGRATIIKD